MGSSDPTALKEKDMGTLIYICYVTLMATPVTQQCHIEEPHMVVSVEKWCDARAAEIRERYKRPGSAGRVRERRVSTCHKYHPGEERRTTYNGK